VEVGCSSSPRADDGVGGRRRRPPSIRRWKRRRRWGAMKECGGGDRFDPLRLLAGTNRRLMRTGFGGTARDLYLLQVLFLLFLFFTWDANAEYSWRQSKGMYNVSIEVVCVLANLQIAP
jgi:hypothetical protein